MSINDKNDLIKSVLKLIDKNQITLNTMIWKVFTSFVFAHIYTFLAVALNKEHSIAFWVFWGMGAILILVRLFMASLILWVQINYGKN